MSHRLVLICAFVALASPAAAGDEIELLFAGHLEYEVVEQHVYVEREPGSGEIYRVTPPEALRYRDSPVYATVQTVANAPFTHGGSAVGPYARGKALGMTLGDFIAATGTGSYECDDGIGLVEVGFDNLVPDGVYTMWYALIPRPPLDPFVALDIPLGARDGSQSPFTADGDGHADYSARFTPCLQLGGIQVDAMLAIAWHSDGNTYGASPGPFSSVTHLQIWANLPVER